MSNKFRRVNYLLFPGLTPLLLGLLIGCSNGTTENEKNINSQEEVNIIKSVAALGQLNPFGEVRILAAPNGLKGGTPRISKLLVTEGDTISKGEILAIFDNRYKIKANLEVEYSKLNQVLNKIAIQKREVNRYKKLLAKGAIASIVLDQTQDELLLLNDEKESLLSSIKAINVDLSQTQLVSPIDGIVLQIVSREGERSDSRGIVEVGSNHLMEALIEVYESDIENIKLGQLVTLISENGGFKGSLKGEVDLISPQVRQRRVLSTDPTGDADARIVEVRVKLDKVSAKMVSHLTGMRVIARFQPL